MLNIAIPELLPEHGNIMLNSGWWRLIGIEKNSDSFVIIHGAKEWKRFITFGLLWHLSLRLNRNCRLLQNTFVQTLQAIEMIVVLFRAGAPCEVHHAHFRRNDGQVMVEVGVFYVH